MPSSIDPTKPVDGVPAVKADLRNNLADAKTELDHGGFAVGLSPINYSPTPGDDKVTSHLAGIDAAVGGTPGTASGTTYTPAGTGADVRSVQSYLRERVSVQDFGTAGDGVTDDLAKFQEAIDHVESVGGGIVYVPWTPDGYGLSSWIRMRDNVWLVGIGRPFLKNLSTNPSAIHHSHYLCLFGDHHPFFFNKSQYTTYDGTNTTVLRGTNSITLQTAADADNLSVGELVWVRSTAFTTTDGGNNTIPDYHSIFEIETKDAGTGVITFTEAFPEDIVDPQIDVPSGVNDTFVGVPMFIVRNARLIGFKTDKLQIAERWSAYECAVEDIQMVGARNICAGNAWVNGYWDRVFGDCYNAVMEIKSGTRNAVFRRMRVHWVGSTGIERIVDVGEAASEVYLEDIDIDARTNNPAWAVQCTSGQLFINRMKLICRSATSGAVFFGGKSQGLQVHDGRITNSIFVMNTPSRMLVFGTADPSTLPPVRNRVENCIFYGSPTVNSVWFREGVNHVDKCQFGNGSRLINSAASGSRLTNSTINGLPSEADGSASITAGANGNANIAHGLAATPVTAQVRIRGDTPHHADVQSLDATNIVVRFKDSSGADVTSGTFTVDWQARI